MARLLEQTNALRRHRISNACESCKNRRTKCSGKPSPCDSCVRFGEQCRFFPESDARRKRKHSGTPKNQELPADYQQKPTETQTNAACFELPSQTDLFTPTGYLPSSLSMGAGQDVTGQELEPFATTIDTLPTPNLAPTPNQQSDIPSFTSDSSSQATSPFTPQAEGMDWYPSIATGISRAPSHFHPLTRHPFLQTTVLSHRANLPVTARSRRDSTEATMSEQFSEVVSYIDFEHTHAKPRPKPKPQPVEHLIDWSGYYDGITPRATNVVAHLCGPVPQQRQTS